MFEQPLSAPPAASEGIDFSPLADVTAIITCTIEGIVEQEDLQLLLSAPRAPSGATAGDLKRVKERHHSVARLIAGGMQQSLVAEISGFTQSYLSTLLNSPAMMELVAFYRAQRSAGHELVEERLRTLALSSVEQLEERIASGEVDDNTLLQAAKLGLDRSGHGPRSTVHQVRESHLFDHAELARLDRAARAESAQDIIPAQAALPAPGEDKKHG